MKEETNDKSEPLPEWPGLTFYYKQIYWFGESLGQFIHQQLLIRAHESGPEWALRDRESLCQNTTYKTVVLLDAH